MIDHRANPDYPRPQLRRAAWVSLDGRWDFAHDDADRGVRGRWFDTDASAGEAFDRQIRVPIPPEAPASGIGDQAVHPIVWYRRQIPHEELLADAAEGHRTLLHFGAVDYACTVWCDGQVAGTHVGGQTPFSVDVTDLLDPDATSHTLVVRAVDHAWDLAQPRGKQVSDREPFDIYYHRTTGIWQSVWAETVAPVHITDLRWWSDIERGARLDVRLADAAGHDEYEVRVRLLLDGAVLAEASGAAHRAVAHLDLPIEQLADAAEREALLWSPEQPTLIDAEVSLVATATGDVVDNIASYLGLCEVSVADSEFRLNGRPFFVRAVLDQGYRPTTHLANLGTKELRAEVELILSMGFNTARIHQKAEDPRLHYWADRLGLLLWNEIGAAYSFDRRALQRLTSEWMDLVQRDANHPCVVAWVPVNESWGFPGAGSDPAQISATAALAQLTRAFDPTRPVLSNEGWEHTDSDILGIHDYCADPQLLRSRYADADEFAGQLRQLRTPGPTPQTDTYVHVPAVTDVQQQRYLDGRSPLMITEFGGLTLGVRDGEFTYLAVTSEQEYAERLEAQFDALRSSPFVAGFCYTQLLDTLQERNGLALEDGTPKLPIETLRHIVTGQ